MSEPAANWKNFIEFASLSDIGCRRSNNQDSLIVVEASSELEWYRRGHMFMVADGMGAHAAGEMASKLACGGVTHKYFKLPDLSAPEALRRSVIETNAEIHARGKANIEFQGMGTTCSILTLLPQGAITAQVGDSRIYRLRKHRLEQLTFDHSLVWEMMAAGQLPKGDSAAFIPKNIITRSLGPHAEVKTDLEGPFPLEVGDTFLICSDGLSGPVSDEEIGLMMGSLSPAEAARTLVDLAILRGGPDNISVIVIRVKQPVRLSDDRLPDRAGQSGEASGLSRVSPAVWIVACVLGLVAGGAALSGSPIPAIVCGVGAVSAALFGAFKAIAERPRIDNDWTNGRLGAGPHTTRMCHPTAATVAPFLHLCERLRSEAVDGNFVVDWNPFNLGLQKGKDAMKEGHFQVALRELSHAMSSLMDQIRRQRKKKASDSSTIEL
jgi:protein phosphatase